MNHRTDCPAYNTKGRELSDQPCRCGARPPTALESKLEALTEAAYSALGFLPRNDPGARMAAERLEGVLAGLEQIEPGSPSPDEDPYFEAIGQAIDDVLGWNSDEDREGGDYPARIIEAAAELTRLKEENARLSGDRSSRQPIAPRLPVGPFRPELTARPILLQVDDAALQQIRDLTAALGNWYDFAAFNAVAAALSALDRTEGEQAAPPEPPAPVEDALRCECGHLRTAHATHALGVFCAHCECGGYSAPEPASEPRSIVEGSRWHGRDGFERIVTHTESGGVSYDREDGGGLLTPHFDSETSFRSYNTWVSDPPSPDGSSGDGR